MTPRRNKWQWSLDLPSHEALEGLSQAERLEVIHHMSAHLNRHPAMTWLSIAIGVAGTVAGVTLHWPLAVWLQSFGLGRIASHMIGSMIAALGAVTVTIAVGYWLLRSVHSRAFRAALCEIGQDVCVECGYWLRGLDNEIARCPECGAARTTCEDSP